MGPLRIVFLAAGVFCAMMCCGFVFAEIWLRTSAETDFTSLSPRWRQPYLGFSDFRTSSQESPEVAGYSAGTFLYYFTGKHPVNSLTERGDFFERLAPSIGTNTPAYFLLGGSAALGDGSNDPKDGLPRLLAGSTGEKVRNGAARAFVSTQERLTLDLYVLPKRPRGIVVLNGFNDASSIQYLVRPGDPYQMGVEYAADDSFLFMSLRLLSRYSRAAGVLLSGAANWELEKARMELSENERENLRLGIVNVYRENVSWMSRRCFQEKIPCWFFLQPVAPPVDAADGEGDFWRIYKELASRPPKLFPGSKFIDLSRLYFDRADLFADPVHLKAQGQRDLAARMAAEMREK